MLAGSGLSKVLLYGQDLELGPKALRPLGTSGCFSSVSVQEDGGGAVPAERSVHQLLSKVLLE